MESRDTITNGPTTEPATQFPVEFKNPNDDAVLMQVELEPDPVSIISRFGMEPVPTNDPFSRVIGSIPQLASAVALNQSFRIVMPPGVTGSLMQLIKDPAMRGLTTTSIIGKNGSIAGTAGLAGMSAFAVPLVVWTVLSFITGQFFLTQIQRNTHQIFEELRNILYFLVAKEESELGARIEFLHYASSNFDILNQGSETRISTLTNLQKINIESLAGLKLWLHNVNRELHDIEDCIDAVKANKDRGKNLKKTMELSQEAYQHINRAIASWQCYSLGTILEIQMGGMFEPSLLDYVKESLKRHADDLRVVLEKAENICNDCINTSYFANSPQIKTGQMHDVLKKIDRFNQRISDSVSKSTHYLTSVMDLESKGMNLVYYNNSFYRSN